MLEAGKIDKSVPIPLYYQLKSLLLADIESGELSPGDMIPAELEIAAMFSISRTTVRQAITELVSEGYLYRVKSKGTFVAVPKINQDFIRRLETFDEQIRRAGRTPATELIVMQSVIIPGHICEKMGRENGTPGVYMFRRRFADEQPIVTVKTWLPMDLCGFVMEHDMARESLYDVLKERPATRIERVRRVLEAIPANADDAALLGVRRGAPIHFFETVGFGARSEAVEYSLARYRGDQNRFEIEQRIELPR